MEKHEGRKSIFTHPIKAVNIGAKLLGDALKQQKTDTVMLDWRPPKTVKLSNRILEILEKIDE